jgi:hypothetical protein
VYDRSFPEDCQRDDHERHRCHAEEFGSFLEFGILDGPKECVDKRKEIETEKKKRKYFQYWCCE